MSRRCIRPPTVVPGRGEAPKESDGTRRLAVLVGLAVAWPTGCQCSDGDLVGLDSEATSGSSGDASTASAASSEESTGEPFDASRWIGRYHYENVFLPFGEHGDPHGSFSLANFEIFADGTAWLLYDECHLDEPLVAEYRWEPDERGWLSLFPGEGESSLRIGALEGVETLRIHLVEPCRELEFEINGVIDSWFPFHPGESCWVDRCTTPNAMQVDYCPGEEPEQACP